MTVPNIATPLGLRNRAILEVFYSSALRRNELISLRLHDVDFERVLSSSTREKDRRTATFPPVSERSFVRLYLGMVRPRWSLNTR